MPNHVRNILTVIGESSEVQRFQNLMCSDTNPTLKEHHKKSIECQLEISKKRLEENNDIMAKMAKKEAEDTIKDINKFQTIFSFDATVPMPPELNGTISPCPKKGFVTDRQKEYQKKFGANNWYDWQKQAWGVKWGAYDVSDAWYVVGDGIGIEFNTAWGPPDKWLLKTAHLFSSLTFTDSWHSEGGETGRITICIKDNIIESETLEEHDWLIENDGAYADEYNMVTQEDYKQAVKDVFEGNIDFGWSQNEKRFLERLKPKDLPLFVNFPWINKKAYEEKITNM